MKIKVEQIKVPYDDARRGESYAPEWWVKLPEPRRQWTVQRVDRVNNTAYGDVFEVTFYGLVV